MGDVEGLEARKILIVSDDAVAASEISEQLGREFTQVRVATTPGAEVSDFEADLPTVLVLAFKDLSKAQEYLGGLLRLGSKARAHAFRTVVLCDKSGLAKAYELCKKGHFDDYVLYWPLSYEGSRLHMSIWVAIRADAARSERPTQVELRAHASDLESTASVAAEGFRRGRAQIEATRRSLDAASASGGKALGPVEAWARDFESQLQPGLDRAHEFANQVSTKRPAILVVEDDPMAQKIMGAALAGSNYALFFAADGNGALLALKTLLPGLILMDVNLPGMDGVEVTKILKSDPRLRQVPVVMLTADARPETVTKSIAAGAASFLVKPFTRPLLLEKLEHFLGSKAAAAR